MDLEGISGLFSVPIVQAHWPRAKFFQSYPEMLLDLTSRGRRKMHQTRFVELQYFCSNWVHSCVDEKEKFRMGVLATLHEAYPLYLWWCLLWPVTSYLHLYIIRLFTNENEGYAKLAVLQHMMPFWAELIVWNFVFVGFVHDVVCAHYRAHVG